MEVVVMLEALHLHIGNALDIYIKERSGGIRVKMINDKIRMIESCEGKFLAKQAKLQRKKKRAEAKKKEAGGAAADADEDAEYSPEKKKPKSAKKSKPASK